jgi:Stress responsive A/B Barrel Domain
MLAHNVYFTLTDNSETAKQALVAACRKYLVKHPGVVFFACGTLQPELERPVNDRGFDVALHVVFDSLDSHNLYQDAPLHHQFVNENRPNWKQVRVFDSQVESA